jgi:hypothetical protein
LWLVQVVVQEVLQAGVDYHQMVELVGAYPAS